MVEKIVDGVPIAVYDYIVTVWAVDFVFVAQSALFFELDYWRVFGAIVKD